MTDKRVDESWKESVRKEKSGVDPQPPVQGEAHGRSPAARPEESAPGAPETDFTYFISTLGMQALSALGVLPDPATGKPRNATTSEELAQAKYLIDIIQMLAGKTKGNLTHEESASLEELMYQLRVRYVEKSGI